MVLWAKGWREWWLLRRNCLFVLCVWWSFVVAVHFSSPGIEGYCRVVPIAVNAFEGGDLAVLVAVSFAVHLEQVRSLSLHWLVRWVNL